MDSVCFLQLPLTQEISKLALGLLFQEQCPELCKTVVRKGAVVDEVGHVDQEWLPEHLEPAICSVGFGE